MRSLIPIIVLLTSAVNAQWKPITSAGVSLKISDIETPYGKGNRLAIDFKGQGGFGLAEQNLDWEVPENFEISFWLKAQLPNNDFEFKLMDPTGQSVWWVKRPAFGWPRDWTRVVLKKKNFSYAWGPERSPLKRIGPIQFGIAASEGGKGTVEFADFSVRAVSAPAPFTGEFAPLNLPLRGSVTQVLSLSGRQAVGGLRLDGKFAGATVELDTEQRGQWIALSRFENVTSPTLWLDTPDLEVSRLRVRVRGDKAEIRNIEVLPETFSNSPHALWESVAKASPRGEWPRQLLGEQNFWTISGGLKSAHEAVLAETGQLEFGKMMPSLAPSLVIDGKQVDWSNAATSQSLREGYLPIPKVRWAGEVSLGIETVATEDASDLLLAKYTVHNGSRSAKKVQLRVDLLPLQVIPSWQFLNIQPVTAPIFSLEHTAKGDVRVNDSLVVRALDPSAKLSAHDWGGTFAPFVRSSDRSSRTGRLFARWTQNSTLTPGETRTLWVVVRRGSQNAIEMSSSEAERRFRSAVESWRSALKGPTFELNAEGQFWLDVARANLGYVLVNRDGPAIQPGSRNYPRTWIRDGSLTASAMLRMGVSQPAKELLEWFAPYVRPDGWVPCVLDKRGPDPLAEHDSHGQFIYLVAETYRFTKDRALLKKMYPVVQRVAGQIETLRNTRKVPGTPKAHWGLLPESASHEGYMDIHRHSYWDDYFGILGLRDAASIADWMGDRAAADRYQAQARDFETAVVESIRTVMQEKGINFIPGAAELGDQDPTSTSIGIFPGGGLSYLPEKWVRESFDQYMSFFKNRAANIKPWDAYTPYEVRVMSTMWLLGERENGYEMLKWFRGDLLPEGWKHWAEIAFSDDKPGRWLGDMPHTWVGSEYISAFRTMFVAERTRDQALIVGAGIPEPWFAGHGSFARGLPTAYGPLNVSVRGKDGRFSYQISGEIEKGTTLEVPAPRKAEPKEVWINGKPVKLAMAPVRINSLPATVEFRY